MASHVLPARIAVACSHERFPASSQLQLKLEIHRRGALPLGEFHGVMYEVNLAPCCACYGGHSAMCYGGHKRLQERSSSEPLAHAPTTTYTVPHLHCMCIL